LGHNNHQSTLPSSSMAPHFGLPGKKKKKVEGSFTWFETTVNGGAVVLSVLQNAANFAPLPYLRGAAATSLTLIQIAQTVKDNRADFRRLCEDAATLTVVVYESRQRSEDPDGWPGAGLKDAVDSFLNTLGMIARFAEAQVERKRFIRVMNSVGDGNKIREFRERLAQAMSRFEVSAHLQSYEILRLIKNMMEDHQNRLNEQIATAPESKEARPLPAVPSDAESPEERTLLDEELAKRMARESEGDLEQTLRDEELAKSIAAEEKRKAEEQEAEQEARKKEREVVDEKLQQILRLLENGPEPGQTSKDKSEREDSSSDEEGILKMVMKNAADKRADRDSRRKDRDAILSGSLGGLNLNGPAGSAHSHYSGVPGRRSGGPARVTNKGSGNVNTSTVYGSHNDNSTVTRINKVK